MIQVPDELRVSVLVVLLVVSSFAGTVAFSGTVTAAAGVQSSLTVEPTSVASNTTNSHDFAVNVTTPVDGANDRLEIVFPDEFDLSSPSVTLATNDSANLSTGTVQVVDRVGGSNAETLEIELTDAGSGTNASVELTGSVSAAAPAGDFTGTIQSTYDVGDDDGTTANIDTGSVQLSVSTYAPSYDTSTSSGTVHPGAVVYQGQEDITFGGGLRTSLLGIEGDAEGQVLGSSIPREQAVGRYSNDGSSGYFSLTVDEPRITTFEVENANGEDVSGGTIDEGSAGQLSVVVDYNFADAENVQITVEGPNGLDVTDAVLSGPAEFNGAHSVALDLSGEDVGFYRISVEGSDDLDFGNANASTTVGLLPNRNPTLHVDAESAVQGTDVVYDVSGSSAGALHLVRIDAADFRENTSVRQQAQIFRPTGDVVERGVVADGAGPHGRAFEYADGSATGLEGGASPSDVTAAYAVVEVDDDTGLAVGSLETRYLDTASVTLDVSDSLLTDEMVNPTLLDTDDAGEPVAVSGGSVVGYLYDEVDTSGLPVDYLPTPDTDEDVSATDDRRFARDDTSFDVVEGSVSLDSPPTYAIGSRIDLDGNASTDMDDVAVYVRNQAEYELVTVDGKRTISVDEDGTFDAEDITLSAGNSMLSLPGRYQLGVVDAADADEDDDGTVDSALTVREFGAATSASRSIEVVNATLDASFSGIVRGEVVERDGGVDVNGTATIGDAVLFVAIGSRGNVVVEDVSVDDDDRFEEDDVSLAGLAEGPARLQIISLGRDGVAGNSSDPLPVAKQVLTGLDADNRAKPLTAYQVGAAVYGYTARAIGTDDSLVAREVRITDAETTIDSVSPDGSASTGATPVAVGETMVVTGSTNRQPDDTTLTVELRRANESVALTSVDDWGADGQWSVEIETADVDPGTYTLEVDDGEATDLVNVDVVDSRRTAVASAEGEVSTSTVTPTPTPTATETSTATSKGTPTGTPAPTQGTGPGFGALLAVVALVAAASLVSRT